MLCIKDEVRGPAVAEVEIRLEEGNKMYVVREGNSRKIVELLLNVLARTLHELRVPGTTNRQLAEEVYNILIELLGRSETDVLH